MPLLRQAVLATAIAGILSLHLALTGAESIRLDELAGHEGQRVRVEGAVRDVQRLDAGTRLTLVADGARLGVFAPATLDIEAGMMAFEGQLGRRGGTLSLFAETAKVTEDLASAVPLSRIAQAPQSWLDRPLHVKAVVQGGDLTDSEGHRLRIARGAFAAGPFDGRILVTYAPSCLCFEATKA